MAKQFNWDNQEILILKEMLDNKNSYQEISKKLNRSVIGIKIKIARIKYQPLCLDCGKRIKIKRKGNRLRCQKCVIKRHNFYSKEWYKNHPKFFKEKRDKLRFNGLREKIIRRDKEKCISCGMTRKEHYLKFGRDITINHIDGTGRNNKKINNSINNLETLCLVCHGKKDAKRRRQDWSMCCKVINKLQKRIKGNCVSCGKKIPKTIKRYNETGNFCERCYISSQESV